MLSQNGSHLPLQNLHVQQLLSPLLDASMQLPFRAVGPTINQDALARVSFCEDT